jgi:galactose mutarotase-like enzyme
MVLVPCRQNVVAMADDRHLRLRAGSTEAAFLPDLGMLGISLRHDDEEVLALPGGLDAYRAGHVTGLPLLAPWANRLGQRHYAIAGVEVDLAGVDLHDDGHGLPIHGTMSAQPGWLVDEATASSARVRFDYGARADLLRAFPFPHEIVLDLSVGEGRLRVGTTVRPTGDRPVPVSFGWHPYFALSSSRADTRLRTPACRHMLLDGRGLPIDASEPQPASSEPIGDRAFDDLYALGDDRRLAIDDGRRAVSVEFDEGYPFAQVYSPADAPFACLEPMTAPTNALVTGAARLVEPGDTFEATFTLSLALTRG